MNITIQTPTLAFSSNITQDEANILKKAFTYTKKTVLFNLQKTKNNRWFRQKNPVAWQEKVNELQANLKGCVVEFKSGRCEFKPGLIPYIKRKVSVGEITNLVEYPELNPLTWVEEFPFPLYPYQKESIDNLINIKHGHISVATGLGKSLILLNLAQRCGLRTVIVTPSKSIFMEILAEFQLRLGKKIVGGYGSGKKDIKKPITIAISKSLTMLKKGTDAYEFFKNKQVVAVDEAHSFASATLDTVCNGVLGDIPYRFFVSATQTRNDGTLPVLQGIIGKRVLDMDIEQGIKGGFLCPLKFTVVKTVSPSSKKKKDPIECKREHFLYNPNIATIFSQIANATWNNNGQSTLILVEELVQISMLARLITIPFSYVHSASKKDANKFGLEKVDLSTELERFNSGDVKVLIGTKSISTGTNIYPTHMCLNWSGGSSEIVTMQGAMGRSTRKLELSKYKDFHKPKPCTQVIDIDVTGQPLLERTLEKRIKFYEKTGEVVNIMDDYWKI